MTLEFNQNSLIPGILEATQAQPDVEQARLQLEQFGQDNTSPNMAQQLAV